MSATVLHLSSKRLSTGSISITIESANWEVIAEADAQTDLSILVDELWTLTSCPADISEDLFQKALKNLLLRLALSAGLTGAIKIVGTFRSEGGRAVAGMLTRSQSKSDLLYKA